MMPMNTIRHFRFFLSKTTLTSGMLLLSLLLCPVQNPLEAAAAENAESQVQALELSLKSLQAQLNVEILRSSYTQERRLQGFDKPLKSTGTLLLCRSKGLALQQKTPFVSSMVFTQDKIISATATTVEVIDAARQPQLYELSRLLQGLISADPALIESCFEWELQGTLSSWQLSLIPQKEPMSLVFSGLRLSGGQYVRELQLMDKQGDVTQLVLLDPHSTPDSLSSAEQELFVSGP